MGKEHTYALTVRWTGDTGEGTAGYRAYSRSHDVIAEGKPTLRGSADPAFFGDAACWSPEDLLLAALSQCHMLTFLSLCARAGIVVVGYEDRATGTMRELPGYSGQFTEVVLSPTVTVATGEMVAEAEPLHREANRTCFIANSVNFPVRHRPITRSR